MTKLKLFWLALTGCKKFKTMQRFYFILISKNRHEHVRYFKALHWLPVRQDYLQDSHLCFPFLWIPPTIPVIMSLCIHSFLHSPFKFRWKTLSCERRELKGFGYWSFSVQAPLVWNNLPAHIWHCSSLSQCETSIKTFLFASAYYELIFPLTGTGCCTWFLFCSFTADIFTDWPVIIGGWGWGLGESERNKGLWDCVCAYMCKCVDCVCVCTCANVWMQGSEG